MLYGAYLRVGQAFAELSPSRAGAQKMKAKATAATTATAAST